MIYYSDPKDYIVGENGKQAIEPPRIHIIAITLAIYSRTSADVLRQGYDVIIEPKDDGPSVSVANVRP